MRKVLALIVCLISVAVAYANDGELYISYHTHWMEKWDSNWKDGVPESAERVIDYFKKQYIPLRIARKVTGEPPYVVTTCTKEDPYYTTFTPEQRRILKNLPFAYRGYIFNSSVKMVDENKAMIDINIHNCGNDHKQTLTLIKERGNWFIDDMYNNSMRNSILKALEDFKKGGSIF